MQMYYAQQTVKTFLERILDGSFIPVRNEIQFQSIEAEDGDLILENFHIEKLKFWSCFEAGSYTMNANETLNDLVQKRLYR